MTNIILAVYLVGVFSNLSFLAGLLLLVLSVATCVMVLYLAFHPSDYYEAERTHVKGVLNHKVFKCLWVVCLLGLLIPSKQTTHIVLGLYVGNEVATEISKSPLYNKAYKALEKYIDEYLQEVQTQK